MTEEVAVEFAKALTSIRDALWLIAGLAIVLTIFFGIAIILYITSK